MSEKNKKQHTIVYEESHPCKVIAEIGCNHKGGINLAKQLIVSIVQLLNNTAYIIQKLIEFRVYLV